MPLNLPGTGWLSGALIFLSSCGSPDATLESILRLEDGRAPASELAVYLASDEASIRARAAEALAKLQDTTSFDQQVRLLSDPDTDVRLWAAFGLGQLGLDRAETPLVQRLAVEKELEVRLQITEALGKVGGMQALIVLRTLTTAPPAELRAEAALAVARQAMRGKRDSLTSLAVLDLLNGDSAKVRWCSAYALWRLEFAAAVSPLLQACRDVDPRVRMFAVRALGALQDTATIDQIADRLSTDPDWRVRVDAARSLGRFPLPKVLRHLTLADSSRHVRRAVIESFGRSAVKAGSPDRLPAALERRLRERLRPIFSGDEVFDWHDLAAALVAIARAAGSRMLPLAEEYLKHPRPRVRARLADALAETASPHAAPLLLRLYEDPETVVKISVLGALFKLAVPSATRTYLRALQEGDEVLTALALKGLAANPAENRTYLPQILSGLAKLSQPIDVEAAHLIFQALGRLGDSRAVPFLEAALAVQDKVYAREAAAALESITGRSYAGRLPARTAPSFPWTLAEVREASGKKAVLTTPKGIIEIELLAEEAPLTALNFVRLVRRGFYDGLSFHRVVPNFVIQGGDPRGDLWGSPGYSIRSEFNRARYRRGVVGMASAGKDTEGCQFFITHSPQPHLDGRYTIFGRVTGGLDVVDQIQTDDPIERIVLRE